MGNPSQASHRRNRCYENHIGVTHPEIASTFDQNKNDCQIVHLTAGVDSRNIWWICPTCQTSWACSPFRRIKKNQGCPSCSSKILKEESLGYHYPGLILEWHTVLNNRLTPFDVKPHSAKRAWWKCKTCSHEWQSVINSRTANNSNCPKCQREKHNAYMKKINLVIRPNNLSVTHPHLESMWDKEKNLPLTFKHVTARSSRTTWWVCPHCKNSFSKRTFNLVKQGPCQKCNSCGKLLHS